MTERVFNFHAGPGALPAEVLQQAAAEMMNYRDTGMGVVELSHRSDAYQRLHQDARERLRKLLAIPATHDVLFLQGGAGHQFVMIPANFAKGGRLGYADTGIWANNAMQQASLYGATYKVTDASAGGYRTIPMDFHVKEDTSYVHITSNNTIYGTAYRDFPKLDVPLVADMSSDLLSRPFDVGQFGLIYAGAQKNIGIAGVTIVIIDRDWMAKGNERLPKILQYRTHAEADSIFNTPPTYAIYVLGLALQWVEAQGGVAEMDRRAQAKSERIYEVLDRYPEVYRPHAERACRSRMNAVFTLCDEAQTEGFVRAAAAAGFVGIQGHRRVGGLRISLYNAVPREGVEKLADWMDDYAQRHR